MHQCSYIPLTGSDLTPWLHTSLNSPHQRTLSETLIALVVDLYALEQIAALNMAYLPDPILATDLETCYHKLPSFASSPANHRPFYRLRTDTNIPTIPIQFETNGSDPRSRSGIISTPVDSSSPPEKVGCFGCYLKRRQRKKSLDDGYWGTNNGIIADLKCEESKLKKMMKEQETVNRKTGVAESGFCETGCAR